MADPEGKAEEARVAGASSASPLAWCLLAAALFGASSREAWRNVDRRNWMRLFGAVVSGGLVGPVLLLAGLAVASAGSVSLWLTLESVATALLARVFFREHMHATTWGAVALTVLASALLSWSGAEAGVAVVFVALACVAWGLDNNLTATIDRLSPAQITLGQPWTSPSQPCRSLPLP